MTAAATCVAHGFEACARCYGTNRHVEFLTRDDCPTCDKLRDDLGRLPIGWCGPNCLMARIRRGEVPDRILMS